MLQPIHSGNLLPREFATATLLRTLFRGRRRRQNRLVQQRLATQQLVQSLEDRTLLSSAAMLGVIPSEIAPGVFMQRWTVDAADAPRVPGATQGRAPGDGGDGFLNLPDQLNGNGLEFNLTPASGMPQNAIDGFQAAANLWSSILTDDIIVNINIDFRALGTGILGQASSTTESMSVSVFRNSLTADATSAADVTAVANLPTTNSLSLYTSNPTTGQPEIDNNGTANNSTLDINTSTSRALGVRAANSNIVDAEITFSSSFTWDFDRSNGITGGAILHLNGTLTIVNTLLKNNSTTGTGAYGGAISSLDGDVSIISSTISNNSNTGTGSVGGGVALVNGNLTISGSTIVGNQSTEPAGGVAYDSNGSAVSAVITNSTISGNTTTAGYGDGIATFNGTLNLQHSTVTLNSAPNGSGSGSGLASHTDGGTNVANTVVLSSIISGNTNSDVDNVGSGANTITSSGFNLIGTGNAAASFSQATDKVGISNPLLAPLGNNGGPTRTHALLAGSPAIGGGDTSLTPATDQGGPGFPRLVGGRDDIVPCADGDADQQ